MKSKLSEHDRTVIVSAANVAIRIAPEPNQREEIRNAFASLLIKLKAYKGYNYAHWLDRGHSEWVAAGKPASETLSKGPNTPASW